MPNPKTGTVTPDVAKAVADIKGGKINFRVDKQANLHFVIGKASFDETKLAENYGAALDEILRAKPASSKGRYLKKVVVIDDHRPGHPGRPGHHARLRRGLGTPCRERAGRHATRRCCVGEHARSRWHSLRSCS